MEIPLNLCESNKRAGAKVALFVSIFQNVVPPKAPPWGLPSDPQIAKHTLFLWFLLLLDAHVADTGGAGIIYIPKEFQLFHKKSLKCYKIS